MDGTLDDFFNEIDQIAPPTEPREEFEWKECFDETSGFSYYWNIKTNQVTWEMPKAYKLWKGKNGPEKTLQPKSSPLFASTLLSTTKIYKIQEDSELNDCTKTGAVNKYGTLSEIDKNIKKALTSLKNTVNKNILSCSDGLEPENEINKGTTESRTVKLIKKDAGQVPASPLQNYTEQPPNSESESNSEDDEVDLLTQIQNRAKVLKDLGGELPPDVRKLVEKEKHSEKSQKKSVTGFSLLASYGDSDEEEQEKQLVKPASCENKTSHSTLFPVFQPIDVTQFGEVVKESENNNSTEVKSLDSRAFHRKRRIGIEFSNKNVNDLSKQIERHGLGFKGETENGQHVEIKNEAKDFFPKFKSAGLMFVKPDTLNSAIETDTQAKNETDDEVKQVSMLKIEETRKMLNEKLTFLSEGREAVSPVQIMIIKMETLYEAVKAGSLTLTYLYGWLKETCSELIKLEKDAAPNGWLLQWDRTNKRYYYRNQQTGDSQWEYPEHDIVGGGEAMDISTTPPPPPGDDLPSTDPKVTARLPVQPPPPPRIRSPTPPPPPAISQDSKPQKRKRSSVIGKLSDLPPLPIDVPPLPLAKISTYGEPLPPGVDSTEVTSTPPPPPPPEEDSPKTNTNDVLGSALNSFYSDLAALENTTTVAASDVAPEAAENGTNLELDVPMKKKKKSRVKVVQGLAMKKKGVSKLVERWKNVQKDY